MDISYLLLLQNLREATGGILNTFFEIVTKLGETSVLMFAIGLIYWCYDKREGIFLLFTLYTNRIINGFIKITACVYRPWIRDPRVIPVPEAMADATGYSFPSGHTANATSFWGGLAAYKSDKYKFSKVLRIILVVIVLLIAFSRNYLGVHTPQDVVVALVIGAAVLFIMTKLMPVIENKPGADAIAMIVGVAFCVLLILYAALKSYPSDIGADGKVIVEGSKMAVDSYKTAGSGIGLFVGWFIERRFIKFSTDIGNTERIFRAVFCVFTYTVLSELSGSAADVLVGMGLGSGLAKAIMQFICLMYFTAGAPAIIKQFSRFFNKTA